MKVALEDPGRAVEKELERQARAYKRAVACSLIRAPGLMQDKLVAEFNSTFRAPVPFTTNRSG